MGVSDVTNDLETMTDYFESFGYRTRTELDVKVGLKPEMYKPAEVVHHHWLYFAFEAFRRLREYYGVRTDRSVETFCDIGTSSGLDAIGAWEGLQPSRVVLTDVVESVLPTARANVLRNCIGLAEEDLVCLEGDLASPLYDADVFADIAYANLPTLPLNRTGIEIATSGTTAASFYPEHRRSNRPRFAKDQLLELYFTFLQEIRPRLAPGGMVLCAIGGRVSWSVIESLFDKCGFDAKMLLFDLKPQEQATECLPVYQQFETKDTHFTFYRYEEAHQHLEEIEADDPKLSCNERLARQRRVVDVLREYAITADEAVDLHQGGGVVGHLVYMVVGHPRDENVKA